MTLLLTYDPKVKNEIKEGHQISFMSPYGSHESKVAMHQRFLRLLTLTAFFTLSEDDQKQLEKDREELGFIKSPPAWDLSFFGDREKMARHNATIDALLNKP